MQQRISFIYIINQQQQHFRNSTATIIIKKQQQKSIVTAKCIRNVNNRLKKVTETETENKNKFPTTHESVANVKLYATIIHMHSATLPHTLALTHSLADWHKL